jgi:Rieske Fe-S protein
MVQKKYTRRNFINRSLKLVAAAALFPLVFTRSRKAEGKSAQGNEKELRNITIDLEDKEYTALKKTGGAAYVQIEGEARPAIVYRVSEREITAYSSKCTHMGCKVELPKNDKVVCHCHNSVFDVYGKRLSGPATKDLEPFSAELRGSTIIVTTN